MAENPPITTIQDALRNFANDGRMSTHYENCWKFHPKCAMMYAADVIDEYLRITMRADADD